jgi:hypothetical protein
MVLDGGMFVPPAIHCNRPELRRKSERSDRHSNGNRFRAKTRSGARDNPALRSASRPYESGSHRRHFVLGTVRARRRHYGRRRWHNEGRHYRRRRYAGCIDSALIER